MNGEQNEQNTQLSETAQTLSEVTVEQSVQVESTEVVATVTPIKKARKKATTAPVEAVVIPTVATLKVNGLKVADMVSKTPREMAVDTTFIVGQKSILLHTSLSSIIDTMVTGRDLNTPVVVSRKSLLNAFCIANEITPLPCKQFNKTENKTTSTYGVVPDFPDKFDVAGSTYQTLGFLKFPVIRTANWVAVKHDVYMLVMSDETYQKFAASEPDMLKDAQFEIV